MVTPRFLSHLFSHMGELSIEIKRIDDRQSFKRVRRRQKNFATTGYIVDYANAVNTASGAPIECGCP